MPTKRPEEYLEMAQAAEAAATRCETPQAKNAWATMAKEYRELAAEILKQQKAKGAS
jgi:hypothetical protein